MLYGKLCGFLNNPYMFFFLQLYDDAWMLACCSHPETNLQTVGWGTGQSAAVHFWRGRFQTYIPIYQPVNVPVLCVSFRRLLLYNFSFCSLYKTRGSPISFSLIHKHTVTSATMKMCTHIFIDTNNLQPRCSARRLLELSRFLIL